MFSNLCKTTEPWFCLDSILKLECNSPCILNLYQKSYHKYLHACSVTQSCLTLFDPMDIAHQAHVHGIILGRILEWVAIFSTRGSY